MLLLNSLIKLICGFDMLGLQTGVAVAIGGGAILGVGAQQGWFGGGDKGPEPQLQWKQAPEYEQQMGLFKGIQEPWMQQKFGETQDIYGPLTKQLGGILGEELGGLQDWSKLDIRGGLPTLDLPEYTLPEDEWAKVWQRGRERTLGEFGPTEQRATERFAGAGMMGQGPAATYFQGLDIAKSKSLDDLAADMAIAEWQEQKQASMFNVQTQQQEAMQNWQAMAQGGVQEDVMNWQRQFQEPQRRIQNAMQFMGMQPQFDIPMPQSIPFVTGMGGGVGGMTPDFSGLASMAPYMFGGQGTAGSPAAGGGTYTGQTMNYGGGTYNVTQPPSTATYGL